jgi:hypothetical protein
VNGEHAHRLERIEQRVDEPHDKMDEFADAEAGNATDLVWLTWAVRKLVAGAAGLSLVSASARRVPLPESSPVSAPQRPVRPAAESAPPRPGSPGTLR